MTQEGQGTPPDDALVPPTSTRTSRDRSVPDEGLVPPFVPGQARPGRGTGEGPLESQAHEFPPLEPQAPEAGSEPEPADVPDDAFPFDMPWSEEPEPDAPGGEPEPWSDAEPWSAEPAGGELPGEEFPIETFEIEPAAGEGEAGVQEPGPGRAAAAEEVAARLEMLASRLRAEGAEGVERELASTDRLTSLLAALLAGHLASR